MARPHDWRIFLEMFTTPAIRRRVTLSAVIIAGSFAGMFVSAPSRGQAVDSLTERNTMIRSEDRAAKEARDRGDWTGALRHAWRLDSLIGGHPGTIGAIARASMLLHDSGTAARQLQRLADMGLSLDVHADSVLAPLEGEYPQVMKELAANRASVGRVALVAETPMTGFVAEGIVADARRSRVLVSSIRHGTIMQVSTASRVEPFIDLVRDGGWSGLGMAIDSVRDRLWVSTMWYAHGRTFAAADSGRSGVFMYDASTGKLLKRSELPRGAHEPGDICLAPNGDLFISDGRDGRIRVIRSGSDTVASFVPPGPIFSPQGCAVDAASNRLFVADYANGIVAVDLATHRVSPVRQPAGTATNGVDGMILQSGRLIAVQNGVRPARIIEMDLDESRSAITAVRVLARDAGSITDPTHLTVSGGSVLFLENSEFGSYDAAGHLRAGVTAAATRIGRILRDGRE